MANGSEVPKIPTEYGVFEEPDYAGAVEGADSGWGMTGQPFAPMPDFMQQLPPQMTPMMPMPPPQPMDTMGQGFPMGGMAPNFGAQPNPAMMGMGGPSPMQMQAPPGQIAQSPGPIARLKGFLQNAYQSDPQQYMLQMAALTQGATNPNLAIGMGQQAVNNQRDRKLKREQIEATKTYRDDQQRYREENKVDRAISRLYHKAMTEGINPSQFIGPNGIKTMDDVQRAEQALALATSKRKLGKTRDSWLDDVYKRAAKGIDSPWDARFEGLDDSGRGAYEELQEFAKKSREREGRLDTMKKEAHDSLMKYRELARKRITDKDKRENLDKVVKHWEGKIRRLESEHRAAVSAIEKRTDLDWAQKRWHFVREKNRLAEEIETIHFAILNARYNASSGEEREAITDLNLDAAGARQRKPEETDESSDDALFEFFGIK